MKCWWCGTELIWGADFDAEDFGYDGEGIVATFSCPNCEADFQGHLEVNKGEDE